MVHLQCSSLSADREFSSIKVQTGSMSKTQAMVKDRISALPDTVLCHILSFLPTLCAVRTTILSRRWKNIWTSVSNRDFDDQRDLLIDPYDCYATDRFPTFIDHVYFFRDSSDIQKLRLKLENGTPDYFARIDGWIRTAVRRNVVEVDLRLFFRRGAGFQFPRSLFVCKTLAVLKVSSNAITYNPPTAGCFPSLKFLHVTVDDYDAYSMEKLFSYCPVLEHLTIDGRNLTDAYNFKVNAPELKTLIISLDECEEEQDFYINAPKLEDLDLKQVALSNYKFQNAKSLVNASIVFRALSPGEQASFPACAIALLAVVSNVKFLSLSIHCLEARYLPPAFGHLNRLKLVLHDCNYWDFLGELLDRSPKLEDLVLETGTKCDEEYSVSQWNQPQDYLHKGIQGTTSGDGSGKIRVKEWLCFE